MAKPQLLASAGTLDDVGALIARFYGGSTKTLIKQSPGQWSIAHARGDFIAGVRVILRKGRYRFESFA